jgi:hypothetical protein
MGCDPLTKEPAVRTRLPTNRSRWLLGSVFRHGID